MPPRKTLQTFLAAARAALAAPPSKRPTPLTFVVGNESADLDSLCSAILLAYFRTHAPPHTLHIPLCHIPRADLALRPEFSAVLKYAAVSADDVLTLDELPGQGGSGSGGSAALKPEDTSWVLVDHNAMMGQLGAVYGDRVVGCIDHHADENKVPRDGELRVIEKSGSCTSLVVEHYRETWDALSLQDSDEDGDARLAHLALGPVLIDTTNLGDANKTTAHDETAVSVAEAKIRAGTAADSYERSAFYAKVAALKEDISHMTFHDIFRKDYKEWTEGSGPKLGTSSVPQSFAYLVEKANGEKVFLDELEKWSMQKGIDLVVVLTGFKDGGEFKRELLAWARTEAAVKAAKTFADTNGDKLQLGTWGAGKLDADEGTQGWRRCWTQARVENSRKQIAPMFRDALR